MKELRKLSHRLGLVALLLAVALPVSAFGAQDSNDPNGAGIEIPTDLEGTQELLSKIYELLAMNALNIVYALAILIVGRWLAMLMSKMIARAMKRAKMDATLVSFASNLCYIALLAFVIIAALHRVGIQTASAVAIVGAAGLAVGFALQGSLSNFASGVLILFFKPIKAGDFVEVGGEKGTVKSIHIFNTVLNSPDNVRVIVPNSQVTGGNIKNYTVNGTRRVDLVVGVSYDDNPAEAKRILEGLLAEDQRILKEPAPTVAVFELGDSSVNLVVRPWVNSADYWGVYFDITEKAKAALEGAGLSIPYPQRDVHLIGGEAPAKKRK
jgi:small conductance mechanosensitive channel